MKIRVPKELRPPSRFEAFKSGNRYVLGKFRVKGVFRKPKVDEWFWADCRYAMQANGTNFAPRVILERVAEVKPSRLRGEDKS